MVLARFCYFSRGRKVGPRRQPQNLISEKSGVRARRARRIILEVIAIMAKLIKRGEEARKALEIGVNQLADTV